MAYTKALHVSANTLMSLVAWAKMHKEGCLEEKGAQYLWRHFKEQFLIPLISWRGKEREKTRIIQVRYANLLVLLNKSSSGLWFNLV